MSYKHNIPCTKSSLKSLRAFIKNALNDHGLSELEISSLVLAIDEVCANLIIHAHNCNSAEFIEVEIEFKQNGVMFKIKDKGEGFDISKYEEPSLEDIIKTQRKGGVGLILVKRIMDKIEFSRKDNQNICHLFKETGETAKN